MASPIRSSSRRTLRAGRWPMPTISLSRAAICGRINSRARPLAARKDRMPDPVPRLDPELLCCAPDHLEHTAHGTAGGNVHGRQRLGVFSDPSDAAVGIDEDHVEWDVGIL